MLINKCRKNKSNEENNLDLESKLSASTATYKSSPKMLTQNGIANTTYEMDDSLETECSETESSDKEMANYERVRMSKKEWDMHKKRTILYQQTANLQEIQNKQQNQVRFSVNSFKFSKF